MKSPLRESGNMIFSDDMLCYNGINFKNTTGIRHLRMVSVKKEYVWILIWTR